LADRVITTEELSSLEQAVDEALDRGDGRGLCVLGRGEISLVLGWPADEPRWACKRLPPFPTTERASSYERTGRRYLDLLAARGVQVLDTEVRQVPLAHGGVAVYCVQPVLPAASLATDVVRADPGRAPAVLGAVVGHILDVTDASVGLDAQLSNWAVTGKRLVYLDITTPLVRDDAGRDELDTDVFLASLPWALRAPVRRFVTPAVVARYHHPRTVVLDLAANLIKERLEEHIPMVLASAGERIDPPLLEAEVRADYRSDARTWAALQALRRVDRAWQRRVRRRTYSFLLPDRIAR
jgi:hypothetical protein